VVPVAMEPMAAPYVTHSSHAARVTDVTSPESEGANVTSAETATDMGSAEATTTEAAAHATAMTAAAPTTAPASADCSLHSNWSYRHGSPARRMTWKKEQAQERQRYQT